MRLLLDTHVFIWWDGDPHIVAIESLPTIHRDPFDRLLVAQAIVENANIVTHDSILSRYPVKIAW